jgi:hypothetical protein
MPRVRYTAEGGHHRTNGLGFDPGDVRDVADALAAHLTSRDDFEYVDAPDTGADGGSTFELEAFLDRTPVGDVADDIRAGAADGHLDELAARADRVTVTDAIDKRRATLDTSE